MPVCVAGMHRSGTSMVTKFLHECGLYLGPDQDLMPPAAENPEGFWENLNFVDLNDEILNQLGGGWDCPPPEPADWTAGRLASLVTRAETILEHFVGREPWGWKDPRSSLTFPFWKGLLPGLRVVVVVRNPLEVALSLRQRNGFSFALGLTLWQITNRRILDATAHDERIVTHFDAYFGNPEPEVRRLIAFLGLPVADQVLAGFRTGATASLRHHRLTAQDLLDADVSNEVFALYRALCDEAEWRDTDGERPTAQAKRADSHRPRSAAATGEHESSPLVLGVGRLSRHAMELRVLQRDLDEHRRSLAGREERIAELELALKAHELAREERDAKIAQLEERVDDLKAQIDEVQHAREAIEREAAVLQQSFADQSEHLEILGLQLQALTDHETELRSLLASAHEQLIYRDEEVLGTLGAVLYPQAPAAPAAVHYHELIQKIRDLVDTNLPPSIPVLVATGGDEALLKFDGRRAWHFPHPETNGITTSHADGSAAVALLGTLRERGAGFLVIPAFRQAWLARVPDLKRHLERTFPVVVREEGTAVVYALAEPDGSPP